METERAENMLYWIVTAHSMVNTMISALFIPTKVSVTVFQFTRGYFLTIKQSIGSTYTSSYACLCVYMYEVLSMPISTFQMLKKAQKLLRISSSS